jgi:PAS domain S-box-containing protein
MSEELPIVLSADDDEDAHLLLQRAFLKAGVKTVLKQVYNGQEVIDYLQGNGRFADRATFPLPNLLLLDIKMPIMSGFGVLEFLKSEPERKTFPTVMFSSSNNPRDLEQAKALGSDMYLVKPGDFKGLTEMVKALCNEMFNPGAAKKENPAAVRPRKEMPKAVSDGKKLIMGESSEIFKLLVQQVRDYAIFVLDLDGRIRSWNEGAKRIKGYEAQEIIGKHFSIFYTRQDLDTEKPAFELRMVNEMGRYEEEGWRVRKDGSRFWANVVITPLRDGAGNLSGYAKVTRDLTLRKMQEEQLQRLLESEERFRLLVEQVKDYAIFFLDARGIISSWNQGARRIKGYTADEIIGRHFSTFYTREDLESEKPARELSIAIRDGRYEEEGWRLRKDGTRFWASVVITALWDKRGNLSGFAKVTRDLTRRKYEEEALKSKSEELEAFAHTLSHDLRGPIRSISSFSELLKDEQGRLSPEEQQSYLAKIHRAAQSMENLIGDVLKLSQVSLTAISTETVSLEALVEETLALQESDILARRAQISVRKPMPSLETNRTMMLQILSNLVANALKFTKEGEMPRIEIYALMQEYQCELHVKDSGPGIPADLHEKIFNLFERGAPGRNSGTGIGLAIVKKAAQRLGGKITVVSRPGHGSDFIVTLPAKATVPQPEQVEGF